jgi:hypothetical protein
MLVALLGLWWFNELDDELALPLCYVSMFNIQDHMFNWNMENHPGQQCNHKNYMALVLAG